MKETPTPAGTPRKDRLIRERVHDPYMTRLKPGEPSVCPQCGATFHRGRWSWDAAAPDARPELCQACHRIKDGYPAGVVRLSGGFVQVHKAEIVNLARNEEKQEKGEHPLNRIMAIDDEPAAIVIRTTDIHLPRRIGDAVHRAYGGDLDYHYDEESYFIRVNWRRAV